MSFPALFLACQAVEHLPPIEDDEFGISWSDLDQPPGLDVTWLMYRSEGAGVIFGVKDVRQMTLDEWLYEDEF